MPGVTRLFPQFPDAPCPSKFFSCNTYGPTPQVLQTKDLRQTYAPAKPFRCNTYKKAGGKGDAMTSHWSYLHTGTLPRLISFVSHSYENTGGVGVFFPFWHSHVGYQGFNPGNERPSKSSTDYCQLITDHCALTCANPVGVTATLALSPLAATLMDLLASVANKGLTTWLSPLDATFTKNRGWGPASR